MAAFPNLPRELAGRINDLGNFSYLRAHGTTYMSHDIDLEYECKRAEYHERGMQYQDALEDIMELNGMESEDDVSGLIPSYDALMEEEDEVRTVFDDLLQAHSDFFLANCSMSNDEAVRLLGLSPTSIDAE
jgi:hypothetical protein